MTSHERGASSRRFTLDSIRFNSVPFNTITINTADPIPRKPQHSPPSPHTPLLPLPLPLRKRQTDAIDAVPLIRRRRVPLPAEHVPQMPPAARARDLRACHAEGAVGAARHGAGDRVEVGGPAAAGFELVRRAVEGGAAGGAFLVGVRFGIGGGGYRWMYDSRRCPRWACVCRIRPCTAPRCPFPG